MNGFKALIIGTGTMLAATQALADSQPLVTQSLLQPSPETANTARVWQDAIEKNNTYFREVLKSSMFKDGNAPFEAESAVFQSPQGPIFVSIGFSALTCAVSGNVTGLAPYKKCDARVAVIRDGALHNYDIGQACHVALDAEDKPVAGTATTASFDEANSTVSLTTVSDGNPVPDCTVQFRVP